MRGYASHPPSARPVCVSTNRVISYHEHNEAGRSESLVARLLQGLNIAVVSDAGTPLICDPGYRLVTAAVEAGVRVVPVPGPSAILAALTASGLPTDAFYFGGFVSQKQAARRKMLESLALLDCTLVFYEAPHRILETFRISRKSTATARSS